MDGLMDRLMDAGFLGTSRPCVARVDRRAPAAVGGSPTPRPALGLLIHEPLDLRFRAIHEPCGATGGFVP